MYWHSEVYSGSCTALARAYTPYLSSQSAFGLFAKDSVSRSWSFTFNALRRWRAFISITLHYYITTLHYIAYQHYIEKVTSIYQHYITLLHYIISLHYITYQHYIEHWQGDKHLSALHFIITLHHYITLHYIPALHWEGDKHLSAETMLSSFETRGARPFVEANWQILNLMGAYWALRDTKW